MKRFFELLNAPSRLFVVVTLCLSFVTVHTMAQDAGEPPAPSEEPVVEEDDDIVIPDYEDDDYVEVVLEDDDETEEEPVVEEPEVEEKPVVEEPTVKEEPVVKIEEEVVDLTLPAAPHLSDKELAALLSEQAAIMELALGQASLDSARAAASAGRWREAAAEYLQANKYFPNNPEVIAGLQKAYSMIDNGPGLDKFQQRQAMERQAARALFDASMADAHDRLQREDFARARRSVEGAIARLDRSDRSLFSETEYRKRREQATNLLHQIAINKEAWEQHRDQLAVNEKNRDQLDRAAAESDERQKIINENLKRVRQLQIRSEEHTSELQSRRNLVCRLLLEKTKIHY